MARKASNSMSSRLTRIETIAGWLNLPLKKNKKNNKQQQTTQKH